MRSLLLNRLPSVLPPKLLKNYFILLSQISRMFKYDTINSIDPHDFSFEPLGNQTSFIVTFQSRNQFMVTHLSRVNRLLLGPTIAGQGLMKRYRMPIVSEKLKRTTFLDLGANVGELSLFLSQHVKEVFAVEPDPIARHCLTYNLSSRKNVRIFSQALGDKKDEVPLFLAPHTADSSLIPLMTKSAQPVLSVQVERGDDLLLDLIDENADIMIKLDAEGFEPEVLRGLEGVLMRTTFIAIDTGFERQGASTSKECIEILEDLGFTVVSEDCRITLGYKS